MFALSYVELHSHSAFSFLDGASDPSELAATAAEQGHAALALTDHDGLSGAMEFAQAAKPLDLRPITGAELTLDDGHHLTLLCEDRTGYKNLCRLLTLAHSQTRAWVAAGPVAGKLPPSHSFGGKALPRATRGRSASDLARSTRAPCARVGVSVRVR